MTTGVLAAALFLSIETAAALFGFVMVGRFFGRRPPSACEPKPASPVDPAALRLRF
jgi:hypothetical protein